MKLAHDFLRVVLFLSVPCAAAWPAGPQRRPNIVLIMADDMGFYDLATDPIEMHDQAASNPGKVRELIALYDAWSERCGVRPWPELAPSP